MRSPGCARSKRNLAHRGWPLLLYFRAKKRGVGKASSLCFFARGQSEDASPTLCSISLIVKQSGFSRKDDDETII